MNTLFTRDLKVILNKRQYPSEYYSGLLFDSKAKQPMTILQ